MHCHPPCVAEHQPSFYVSVVSLVVVAHLFLLSSSLPLVLRTRTVLSFSLGPSLLCFLLLHPLTRLQFNSTFCTAPRLCASTPTIEARKQWVGLTMDQDSMKKNANLQRPMSPHLTVYSFPMPAILSISHRITGVALTGAVCAAGIGLAMHPLEHYVTLIQVRMLRFQSGKRRERLCASQQSYAA